MTAPAFLLTAALLVATYLAVLIVRIGRSLLGARRNIADAKASQEHQASVRLFVEAQTKLMKLDTLMGVMLSIGLVVMLALARHAILLLGTA